MWCSGPVAVHSGSAEQGREWDGRGWMMMVCEKQGSAHVALCVEKGTGDATGFESFESVDVFGIGEWVA